MAGITFGGLFGHDKLSAGASGKYTDNGELPALPGQAPVYPQTPQNFLQAPPQGVPSLEGTPYDVSGIASQPFNQVIGLPKAPPPRRGAFDSQHYRQTMLQMAAGFFGSQNFGDGMANAARAIAGGNEAARQAERPTLGGPDDAFEIYTDPETGEHSYLPIQAVHDYNARKAGLVADLKNRRQPPSPKDSLDAWGRLASVVAKYPPEQQAQAWREGREHLEALGFEGVPDTYSAAYREYGAPVPTMARSDTGAANANETARHNGVMEGHDAVRVAQSGTRVGLAVKADGRAAKKALSASHPNVDPDGYEWRIVKGRYQRRKVR